MSDFLRASIAYIVANQILKKTDKHTHTHTLTHARTPTHIHIIDHDVTAKRLQYCNTYYYVISNVKQETFLIKRKYDYLYILSKLINHDINSSPGH